MEWPKTQDFGSVRISKNKSHKTCKLNSNIGKLIAFLKCHMDESTAVAEKNKGKKSKRKYTMMHLG